MKIKERGVTNQLKTRRRRLTEHYSASKPTVNRIANGRNRKAKQALINFQNRRLPGADAKKLERVAGGGGGGGYIFQVKILFILLGIH